VWPEGLGKLKKFIHLIGSGTCYLPACSIVPLPTTLPRSFHIPNILYILELYWWFFCVYSSSVSGPRFERPLNQSNPKQALSQMLRMRLPSNQYIGAQQPPPGFPQSMQRQQFIRYRSITNSPTRYRSITNSHIRYRSITNSHIRYRSVTNSHIRYRSVTNSHIRYRSITAT
jgi:hypothetical protein